jgi:hypothetical protein
MEYLLGSLVTLVTILVVNRIINKKIRGIKAPSLLYTQSVIHTTLRPFLPTNKDLRGEAKVKTQSKNHQNKNTMRVLFVENKAYWIKENTFYTADAIDGMVDEETTKRVDIMGMNRVQLEEMSFIVGKLTEGIDDENRYSGK